MGRWRPAQATSTTLITREGYERLRAEFDQLWRRERPAVVAALSAAAAEGDRSENAEYQYRKKQLAGMDRRLRYLGKRLEQLRVVEDAPSDPTAVYFGAWIEVERLDTGEVSRYRIVGPDETDAARGYVSIDSPLARAALKRRVDDEFVVGLPTGPARHVLLDVSYAGDSASSPHPR